MDKVRAAILSMDGKEACVVRTRVYLRHASDWEAVSAAHARAFGDARPANTLIGGVDLVGGYLVEVEAEAEVR
jgi:enamine deaminase RidA (YjgF/YER057c/UK114 family)